MERCFDCWKGDAGDLLNYLFPGIFDGHFELDLDTDLPASSFVFQFPTDHQARMKGTMQIMMEDVPLVTRKQLQAFFFGRRYVPFVLGEKVWGDEALPFNKFV